MAWTDVLESIMGMRRSANDRINASRNQRAGYVDQINRAEAMKGDAISGAITGVADTFLGFAKDKMNKDWQEEEAEKQREFQAGESGKEREFQASEREAVQDFNTEAQEKNYTYEYTYEHPWSGKSITLAGDGSTATHELNNTRLREFINMWNAVMRDQVGSESREKGENTQWTNAMQTGRGELYLRLQQSGLMDANYMPTGDMEDSEYASRFNETIGSVLTDDLMKALLNDYGLEETPENVERLRGLIEKEAQTPIDIEPIEPEQSRERRSFVDVAGNPADWIRNIGPAIRYLREDIGTDRPPRTPQGIGDIADEFSGASVAESEALAEAERQGITGDISGAAQNIQTTENPDIQGMWEQQMLKDIMSIESQASPSDLQTLQGIYDLIAGKGKWEEQGRSRSDWKAMLAEINSLVEKYK